MRKQSQLTIPERTDGFLLIELLVALLLVAVLTFIIACYQGLSIQASYDAVQRWKAVTMFSSFIARVTHDPTILKKNIYEEKEVTITWEPQTLEVSVPAFLAKVKKHFKALQVHVAWNGFNNKRHSFTCLTGMPS